MDKLLELAERVKRAAGADRELDCLIHESRRADLTPEMRVTYYGEPTGEYFQAGDTFAAAPRFTASLDAAMALVPEGWRWVMRQAGPGKGKRREIGFFARLESADFKSVTYGKGETWLTDHIAGQEAMCWAATPALALCAAALRARAAQPPPTTQGNMSEEMKR